MVEHHANGANGGSSSSSSLSRSLGLDRGQQQQQATLAGEGEGTPGADDSLPAAPEALQAQHVGRALGLAAHAAAAPRRSEGGPVGWPASLELQATIAGQIQIRIQVTGVT